MCIHDPQTRTVRRNAYSYSAATRTTYVPIQIAISLALVHFSLLYTVYGQYAQPNMNKRTVSVLQIRHRRNE